MIKTSRKSVPTIDQLTAQMRSIDVDQWQYLAARITDPTTARIIVEYLDSDPAARLRHAGIYVRARETVQQSRVRYAKAFKWGQRFARLLTWLGKLSDRVEEKPAGKHRQVESKPALVWPTLNV